MAIGTKRKAVKRQRGVMVRAVVPPQVEQKLREMAAKESRTLSAMAALILTRAVEGK